MIQILSWNIQNGEGVDGIVSLERIADTIFSMSNPDVICLQEVSRNCKLKDGTQPDQLNQLSDIFKEYEPFFGPAYNVLRPGENKREQFGNIILSKLPVLSSFNHILPQPTDSSFRHMPRQVSEVTVKTSFDPICIMTTHLEYGSQDQRYAQVKRILEIKDDINGQNNNGFWEPGETLEIFPTIKNYWGPSDDVRVGIEFAEFEDTSKAELIETEIAIGSVTAYANLKITDKSLKIKLADGIANNVDIKFKTVDLTSENSPSTSAAAANGCPPPPIFLAISLTLYFPFDLKLNLTFPFRS